MNKIIRVILCIASLYIYFILIVSSTDVFSVIVKIIGVCLMLMLMEAVRRRGATKFNDISTRKKINEMSQEQFLFYIGDLYRRKGYTINIKSDRQEKGYDISAVKGHYILQISCIAIQERQVLVEDLESIKADNKKSKLHLNRTILVITNGEYTEEAILRAEERGLKLVNGTALIQIAKSVLDQNKSVVPFKKIQRA